MTHFMYSADSEEVVSECDINISRVKERYLVVTIQRKNILENTITIILNLDLLGMATKVNRNHNALCVMKCFE